MPRLLDRPRSAESPRSSGGRRSRPTDPPRREGSGRAPPRSSKPVRVRLPGSARSRHSSHARIVVPSSRRRRAAREGSDFAPRQPPRSFAPFFVGSIRLPTRPPMPAHRVRRPHEGLVRSFGARRRFAGQCLRAREHLRRRPSPPASKTSESRRIGQGIGPRDLTRVVRAPAPKPGNGTSVLHERAATYAFKICGVRRLSIAKVRTTQK